MMKEHPIWLFVVLACQLAAVALVGGVVVAVLMHAIDAALRAAGIL